MDFLAGNHVRTEFVDNKKVKKSLIRDLIYCHNYSLTKKDNSRFDSVINDSMNIEFNDEEISSLKAQEIYDQFDFCERQAKCINIGIRNYDYFGLSWYLPFWDKELINFDSDEAHIKTIINKKDIPYRIDIHLKKNSPKGIAINKIPIRKASELFGVINIVFFSPEDLNIIKNGPAERRKFIDMELKDG